jgi:hypothetical protein
MDRLCSTNDRFDRLERRGSKTARRTCSIAVPRRRGDSPGAPSSYLADYRQYIGLVRPILHLCPAAMAELGTKQLIIPTIWPIRPRQSL